MGALLKLPRLNINTQIVVQAAENREDIYTIESEMKGITYLVDKNSILILTPSDGYLRLEKDKFKAFTKELSALSGDIDWIVRNSFLGETTFKVQPKRGRKKDWEK